MPKRTFKIEWPDDHGPLWMNKSNLLLCLTGTCKNTQFTVTDVTGDGNCDPSPESAGPATALDKALAATESVQGGAHHLSAKRLLDEIMGDPADGDMTPEEGDAAYDAAPAIPIPAEEIDRIVQRVTQPTPAQQPGYRERLEALYSEIGAIHARIKEDISPTKFPRKHLVLSVLAAASAILFVAIKDFAADLDQTKGGG